MFLGICIPILNKSFKINNLPLDLETLDRVLGYGPFMYAFVDIYHFRLNIYFLMCKIEEFDVP